MAEQATVELIVIIGSVLGTFAATLYPYWSKLRENPEIVFEKKFLGTAAISLIASLAVGLGLFPTLLDNVGSTSTMSLASVFAITALTAFGLNRASNMLMPSGGTTLVNTTAVEEGEGEQPTA